MHGFQQLVSTKVICASASYYTSYTIYVIYLFSMSFDWLVGGGVNVIH